MNINSQQQARPHGSGDSSPILLVPYMWIGDFVRCHSVVKVLRARWPGRAVDVLTTPLCAPLLDYMPGVRKGVAGDLPRRRLALAQQRALAERLRPERYGTALVMSRKWKAALAPFLAGIPQRVGFVGEMRFGLINDLRFGERDLPRMIDRCAALAMPRHAELPAQWPLPELVVSAEEIIRWRRTHALEHDRRAVALAPGAVGPSKRWPKEGFASLARQLGAEGLSVWVVGGPQEKQLAQEIVSAGGVGARDLTGTDLRQAIVALAAANVAVSNDSGLLHVAAALGTPSIGIFGPTSPWHWAPLNPLAATVETDSALECRPCHKPTCRVGHHRCMQDIPVARVLEVTQRAVTLSALAKSQ
jgi:heptosyltransferase-2